MLQAERIHALVHGRVQGVFFRDYTRRKALELKLTGWVRNLSGGEVETEFQGNSQQLKLMLDWLGKGSPLSLVTGVESSTREPYSKEQGFEIRY